MEKLKFRHHRRCVVRLMIWLDCHYFNIEIKMPFGHTYIHIYVHPFMCMLCFAWIAIAIRAIKLYQTKEKLKNKNEMELFVLFVTPTYTAKNIQPFEVFVFFPKKIKFNFKFIKL